MERFESMRIPYAGRLLHYYSSVTYYKSDACKLGNAQLSLRAHAASRTPRP